MGCGDTHARTVARTGQCLHISHYRYAQCGSWGTKRTGLVANALGLRTFTFGMFFYCVARTAATRLPKPPMLPRRARGITTASPQPYIVNINTFTPATHGPSTARTVSCGYLWCEGLRSREYCSAGEFIKIIYKQHATHPKVLYHLEIDLSGHQKAKI